MTITLITRSGRRITCTGNLTRILDSLGEIPRLLKLTP